MTVVDVVVVGGRVAGAATARLLADAGARVVVVDRDRLGSDTLSTHGLMRPGVLQLSRWGLLDKLAARGTPAIRSTTFHHADGGNLRISVRATPGVDALYAPRRHLLDRVLVEAAADAGADVRHRTTAIGLLRDDDGRVVGVRTSSGEIRAELTIGADGIRSMVAREVAAPVVRQGSAASSLLYRYVGGVSAEGYQWAYGAGAAAGLLPTNDDEWCLFAATTPARMSRLRRAGAESAFDELVRDMPASFTGALREATPASRLHGWRGVPGFVRQPYGAGWALVGDAGYFKDPITTHGMTDALRDAELLADAVLRGAPLSSYQSLRDRLSRALFDVTESVAGYAWDDDEIRRLLRRVSSAMSDELDHLDSRMRMAAGAT